MKRCFRSSHIYTENKFQQWTKSRTMFIMKIYVKKLVPPHSSGWNATCPRYATFVQRILKTSQYLTRASLRTEKRELVVVHLTSKADDTKGWVTLGHSNWTICNLLNWSCSKKFPPFYPASHNKQFPITPERGREEGTGAENGKFAKGNSPKVN